MRQAYIIDGEKISAVNEHQARLAYEKIKAAREGAQDVRTGEKPWLPRISLPNPEELNYWVEQALSTHYPDKDAVPVDFDPLFSVVRRRWVQEERSIPVSRLNCENTIYGSEDGNVRARLWHECAHCELNLGFGLNDEVIVARHQLAQLREMDAPFNVIRAVHADTIGMLLYNLAHYGKFPENQKEFCAVFINQPQCPMFGLRP